MICSFFVCYFICSVEASAILCAWLIFRKKFWNRYQGQGRLFFWILLAAFLSFPIGIISARTKEDLVPYQRSRLLTNSSEEIIGGESFVTVSSPVASETGVHRPALPNLVQLLEIVSYIWILGVFASLIFEGIGCFFFRRKIRRWGKMADSDVIKNVMNKVSHDENVGRVLNVLILKDLPSPCLAGLLRPFVLLPRENYSTEEARLIIKHELTHYRKKHLWIKTLFLLARSLHWFNPLIYWAWQYADADMENCCDEIMLAGESMHSRKKYMETLLGTIEGHKVSNYIITYTRKNLIKERFAHIQNFDHKRRCSSLICMMVVMIVLGNILVGCGVNKMEKSRERQIVTQLSSFINDFNGTIAEEASINLEQYISNSNLKRFSERMIEYEKKQEAENLNAINYGANNIFKNATCSKLSGDVYYVTLQFEYDGSGMKGQFLVELKRGKIDILDFYFGMPDGFDTITTGHLAERKLENPDLWNDNKWVASVFEKMPKD
ncbi:MAG: M56 family metallopeptidase [Lachnospiraceae bacterium]|nr:M56 family metallopeptidase [Lachnospiraceae bacterium]